MSYASHDFREWGRMECVAEDGRAVRACLDIVGVVGAVRHLGDLPKEGALSIAWKAPNAGSETDALAPVLLSTATLHTHALLSPRPDLADGLLSLYGLAPGTIRLRVLTNADGTFQDDSDHADWDLGWCGFLQPGGADAAGRMAVPTRLAFRDGLHLLADRPWLDAEPAWDAVDGSGDEERMVDALVRILKEMEGASGGLSALETAVQWFPYVPGDAVAATTDPLRALKVMRAALWNPGTDGVEHQTVAVRQIVARVLGRVCQARGAWSVAQPGLLARTRGLSVPVHTYDLSAHSAGDAGTRTTPDTAQRLFDASGAAVPGYGLVDDMEDARGTSVVEATSTYDFEPDLDGLVFNHGFGILDPDDDEVPLGWALTGRAERFSFPVETTGQDNASLQVFGSGPSDPLATATQSGYFDLSQISSATTDKWRLEAKWLFVDPVGIGTNDDLTAAGDADGGVLLTIGDYAAVKRTGTVGSAVLKGRDTRVPFSTLGTVPGAVSGAVIIQVGTVLTFFRSGDVVGTLEVTEPVYAGDASVRGDLDVEGGVGASLASGDTADYFVWSDAGSPAPIQADTAAFDQTDGETDLRVHRATLPTVAPDGTRLSGPLEVKIVGHKTQAYATYARTWPYVSLQLLSQGAKASPINALGRRVRLPAGASGVGVEVPASGREHHRFGDGPSPLSRTRLRVVGASGAVHDTARGDLTAWRTTPWATDAPASGEGPTIDGLAAREALSLVSASTGQGPERRLSFSVRLESSGGSAPALLWPDRPFVTAVEGRLQAYASSGATLLSLSRPPTPGEFVRLSGTATGDATPEAVTASAVAPRIGGVAVTTGPTSGAHYPQERAWVGVLCLATSLVWDPCAARYAVDALALAPADTDDVVEELLLDT